MSKTRRGVSAAALITVVVGSVGLISTLNAGAEEAPAPAPTPVEQPEIVPPARLPWGQTPSTIQRGPAGASSRRLQSEGLDAAPPERPGARYAPKGRTSREGDLDATTTEVVPPKPPSLAAAATQTVDFHYNAGSQAAVTDGVYANVTVGKPTLATTDYHSLAELAVQSADGAQAVEVGWTVDRVVNGDAEPHLFVYHWINGQPTCYNACGFVRYSQTIGPGDTLPQDTVKKLGIQYANGAWWIAYDTEWVGYYPASRWAGTFTQSGNIQVFGEVAASSSAPCTQMGNGRNGNGDGQAARISSVTYLNGPAVDMYVRTTSDYYDVARLTGRTFRYGGAGAC
ncbi:MAG TPA: neprosin family prolyl endopeptidase [Actinoplanes sp.]|nr:neprosin family prolyl endopeptidase [Actinoplanes sp.]